MSTRHLLILGGTGEAAALARGALARFGESMAVTTALAGRTRHPGPIPGQVRIGGGRRPPRAPPPIMGPSRPPPIPATPPLAAGNFPARRLAAGPPRHSPPFLRPPPWQRPT